MRTLILALAAVATQAIHLKQLEGTLTCGPDGTDMCGGTTGGTHGPMTGGEGSGTEGPMTGGEGSGTETGIASLTGGHYHEHGHSHHHHGYDGEGTSGDTALTGGDVLESPLTGALAQTLARRYNSRGGH